MIFLPECFAYMGLSSEDSLSQSESLTGPTMRSYCDLAKCAPLCDKGLGISVHIDACCRLVLLKYKLYVHSCPWSLN